MYNFYLNYIVLLWFVLFSSLCNLFKSVWLVYLVQTEICSPLNLMSYWKNIRLKETCFFQELFLYHSHLWRKGNWHALRPFFCDFSCLLLVIEKYLSGLCYNFSSGSPMLGCLILISIFIEWKIFTLRS